MFLQYQTCGPIFQFYRNYDIIQCHQWRWMCLMLLCIIIYPSLYHIISVVISKLSKLSSLQVWSELSSSISLILLNLAMDIDDMILIVIMVSRTINSSIYQIRARSVSNEDNGGWFSVSKLIWYKLTIGVWVALKMDIHCLFWFLLCV